MNYYIILCPHCKDIIQIMKNQLNCKIFRHGIYKKSLEQINPHMSKKECDYLYHNNLIYGCGKPFKVEINNGSLKVDVCDYI